MIYKAAAVSAARPQPVGGRCVRIRHRSRSRSSIVSSPSATGSECRSKLISRRSAGGCLLFLNQSARPPRPRPRSGAGPSRTPPRPRRMKRQSPPARRASAAAARPPNRRRTSSRIQNRARAAPRQSRRAATRSPATAPNQSADTIGSPAARARASDVFGSICGPTTKTFASAASLTSWQPAASQSWLNF